MENLTSVEAAKKLKLSTQTLANWRHNKIGPRYLKVGGRILYPVEWLVEYQQGCVVETRDTQPEAAS